MRHETNPQLQAELAAWVAPGFWRQTSAYLARPAAIVRGYRREDLTPDLLAGLTVAIVMLPQAIAYAAIANLPPYYGLYSAIVASVVGALWGSSRFLSTGPTNTATILVLSVLAPIVAVNSASFLIASSIMAVLVGVFRLAFGLARLGFLVNFVSRAVLLGFTAGAGVLIAVNQLRNLLHLPIPVTAGPVATVTSVVREAASIHLPSLAIGIGTIAAILAVNRFSKRFPGSLIALVGATSVVMLLGPERLGVAVVGTLPSGIPQPTDLHEAWLYLSLGHPGQMVTGALAVALLGLVEAISISQSIARSSRERLDVNQEFVGQGLANIVAGFFTGYVCSGSFTRSLVTYEAGARTQLTNVFAGVFVLAGSIALGPSLAFLPRSALAGVLMLVAWGMVDRAGIARLVRTSHGEAVIMAATFAATLIFPLEFAVLGGVIFSLAVYVYRSSLPRVVPVVPDETFRHLVERPNAPQCPQLAVLSIQGSLFFGATQHVEAEIRASLAEHPEQRTLLLRMHGVNRCDFTGIEMLESITRTLRTRGGDVYMVRPRPPVLEMMADSGFLDFLGRDHLLPQEGAIETLFETVLDPAVCCYRCSETVFAECYGVPRAPRDLALPPYRPRPVDPAHHLSVAEAEALITGADPLILDVREPEEFALGHLPGARLLPLGDVLEGAAQLPRDRAILLVCRSGRRSSRALRALLDTGLSDVQNLRGGLLSWRAAGRPLLVE